MVMDVDLDTSKLRLDKKWGKIRRELEKEVEVQTRGGALWLREDVLRSQRYVGDSDFPDVKKSTKKAKQRAGEEKVLIRKGNLLRSIDVKFKKRGLVGIITGGTGYYKHLRKKWKLERLFLKKRGAKIRKALRTAVRRGLRK